MPDCFASCSTRTASARRRRSDVGVTDRMPQVTLDAVRVQLAWPWWPPCGGHRGYRVAGLGPGCTWEVYGTRPGTGRVHTPGVPCWVPTDPRYLCNRVLGTPPPPDLGIRGPPQTVDYKQGGS